MKILILDVYPKRPYRITKDMNGGFGTSNDLGDGIVPKILAWLLAKYVDWPPLFAAYAMGVIREKGHQVRYSRKLSDIQITDDLVVIPSSIVAHETELAAVRCVVSMRIPCAVIGPFATSQPEEYVRAGSFVIAGEPENFFDTVMLTPKKVAELSGVIQAGMADVTKLPYPAWDIIFDANKAKMGFIGRGNTLPIIATRGCPYSCYFYCTYPLQQGRKVRQRSPGEIVQEMVYWYRKLGVTNFSFRDPVFSINRRHTLELCEKIRETGISFSFGIETHLKNLDEEISQNLASAGLKLVYVGIESVSPEVISGVQRFTVEQELQIERIRFLEKLGIKVKSMFILGFPQDTKDSIAANIKFAKKLCTHFAQFSVFTPYPGTPAYNAFKDKITAVEREQFTQWHLIYRHDSLSKEDIRRALSRAYTSYYTSPKLFVKWLFQ